MLQSDQKNLLLAVILCAAIIFGWEYFFQAPRRVQENSVQSTSQNNTLGKSEQEINEQKAIERENELLPLADNKLPTPSETSTDSTLDETSAPLASKPIAQEQAIDSSARVKIKTPALLGSIALKGAKLDTLDLQKFNTDLSPDAQKINLLKTGQNAYFVQFAWRVSEGVQAPSHKTIWKSNANLLTPEKPLLLHWENDDGVRFEQHISIDENYMLTIQQRVINRSNSTIAVQPYGVIQRKGKPQTLDFYILHEGLIGYLNQELEEISYKKILKKQRVQVEGQGGWIGITDKYWMTALIPDPEKKTQGMFRAANRNEQSVFQTDIIYTQNNTLAPNESNSQTSRIFAGAKSVPLLDSYSQKYNIAGFDLAVDFGWFYFITKPIYSAINFFSQLLGNFGLAILALTVTIKIIFLPLSYKSYVSIGKMKDLQPEMLALRERHKDDKKALQKDMLELYKKHGVNPVAGCLPILLQIPVFFALYKVLFISIEMRHAPFFGWIHDLSAADPLGMLTLFGLLPWQVPQIIEPMNLGLWPIAMGLSMWLQQKMNPAPVDPIQKKIFAFLPLLFTFLLGGFPAGLVIYWTWNNILTIAQQWAITRHVKRRKLKKS